MRSGAVPSVAKQWRAQTPLPRRSGELLCGDAWLALRGGPGVWPSYE